MSRVGGRPRQEPLHDAAGFLDEADADGLFPHCPTCGSVACLNGRFLPQFCPEASRSDVSKEIG